MPSTKESREELFAALENGEQYPCTPRAIKSADDLDEMQLRMCFEVLYATGRAADPDIERNDTRKAMEGFLDAVFKDWDSNAEHILAPPEMDFVVRKSVLAGGLCGIHTRYPNNVHDINCQTPVYAVATFTSKSANLETAFTTADPSRYQNVDFVYPWGNNKMHWSSNGWFEQLMDGVEDACLTKINRHNKHVAIWHVRDMIQQWAKGALVLGDNIGALAVVRAEELKQTFVRYESRH